MQLSVVEVQEVIGDADARWECTLENAPLVSKSIQGHQLALFHTRLFYWKDFSDSVRRCSGTEMDFISSIKGYESGTHPEGTRTGPVQRPNQLSIVVFVSANDEYSLRERLKASKITIHDWVIATQSKIVLHSPQSAHAA